MEDVMKFTQRLAIETGKILVDYFQSRGIKQAFKDDQTIVTEADLEADHLIRARIKKAFPDDGILSEEENTIYPKGKGFVWVIDPLDGTTNFSLGLQYWGVLITRIKDGIPDLTVQFFPLLDEIYTSVSGEGAYLNNRQLQVNPNQSSRKVMFFSCCSRTHRRYKVDIPHKPRILGSAGYGLSTIARGSAILALEVTPKVWDLAGSVLITKEAGGYIAPLEGGSIFPLLPGMDYKNHSYPILAARSEEKWFYGKTHLKPREF